MDFSALLNKWGAGQIEDNPSPKMKTREIGGLLFQFRILGIEAQADMALDSMAHLNFLAPLFAAGAGYGGDMDDKAKFGAYMIETVFPKVMAHLGNADFRAWLKGLVKQAYVERDGKFAMLSDVLAFDHAFSDDLTRLVPVAATVLEVNLASAFFGKVAALASVA